MLAADGATDATGMSGASTRFSGELDVSFEERGGVTRLVRHEFSGLIRASRPVYGRGWASGGSTGGDSPRGWRDDGAVQVQIVHLGPGIMGGDEYRQIVRLGEGTRVRIEYQSYTKVLPGSPARQLSSLYLAKGSLLSMGCNVVLPFAGAGCVLETNVYAEQGSMAFVPEILVASPVQVTGRLAESGGATAMQPTSVRRLKSTFRVIRGSAVELRDCVDIGYESLAVRATWAGAPVLGSVYILGLSRSSENETALAALQHVCDTTGRSVQRAGVSSTEAGDLVLRVVGSRVQDVADVVFQAWTAVAGHLTAGG